MRAWLVSVVRVLVPALVLVAAGPARAERPSVQGDVAALLDDTTSPPHRARLLQGLCSPGRPANAEVLAEGIERLLGSELRPANIDGARLAACRNTPALIPALYAGFQRAKASPNADPDVYERLLRALQAHPVEEIREALDTPDHGLGGPVHAELLDLAWDRLQRNWLEPLAAGRDVEITRQLGGDADARALAEASAWLGRVLDAGPQGLVRLQTDSGDLAFVFVERLQGWHLASLIAHGSDAAARVAVEICLQSPLCDGSARSALAARLEERPDAELAGRLEALPEGQEDPSQIALLARPVVAVDVPPYAEEQVVSPPTKLPLGALVALGLLAFWGTWVAAARARPGWRGRLFAVGAVALAPTLLALAELVLLLAGVEPLAARSDAGWSEPAALRSEEGQSEILLASTAFDDGAWFTTINSGARWQTLRADPPDGVWRVAALGESSVHASNHLVEESFLEVLGRRLRLLHPDREIEVVHGGIGGAISDDVVRAGRDALAAGADVLILYHGVNDLGRLNRLAAFQAFSPAQLGVRVLLDEIRLVRVITDLLPAQEGSGEAQGAELDPDVSADTWSMLTRLAVLRCTRNQQRLVREAAEAGVPVIVVGQALRQRPDSGQASVTEELLDIAATTASRTGATLIDGHAVVTAHGEATGATTDDYFWDEVHPSRLGHAVLGEALAPTVSRLLSEQ